ncbi:hypothetical protein WKH57_00755 [Niallia taxi]|uniref:spike base protein, RCAP_Rcc01079 family n=1 Tax=Niallia taxi TaxID=2499688 RepID=UPI00316E7C0B
MDINNLPLTSGRQVKENSNIINTADILEEIYKALIVEKNVGGSKAVKAINASLDTTFPTTSGVYIGTSGNLSVTMKDGSEVAFVSLASGVIHPLSITKIKSVGTTASNVLLVY